MMNLFISIHSYYVCHVAKLPFPCMQNNQHTNSISPVSVKCPSITHRSLFRRGATAVIEQDVDVG